MAAIARASPPETRVS